MGQLVKDVSRTCQQLFWGVSVTKSLDSVSLAGLACPQYGFVFLVYLFPTLVCAYFLHGLVTKTHHMKGICDQLGIYKQRLAGLAHTGRHV